MDLRQIYGAWVKSARALVVAGGIGLVASTGAYAQECETCDTGCTSSACCDDSIFENAGSHLAAEIERLSAEGNACCTTECAPACEPACETTCEPGCSDEGVWTDSGSDWLSSDSLNVGGWVQYGYYADSSTPNAGGLNFNDNASFGSTQRGGVHQAWLFAEKVADGSNGIDWGFRVDAMYGLDADDTQAFGQPNPTHWDNQWRHGIYGFALPQAYATVAGEDWNVKIGHFYTLVGYEVVQAPDNFFFSHAYTQFNSEPFTHTGFVAEANVSDDVTVYGGWVAGWDTGFDRFADGDNSKGNAFLGGVSVGLTEDVTMTYITTVGDLGVRGEGYSHSVVLDVALTDDLNYVFQSDLVETNANVASGFGNHEFSVNQYLFYTINDQLSAGVRGEWWSSNATNRSGLAPSTGNADHYEITAGLNIKPLADEEDSPFGLIIRPEVRHDWSKGIAGGAGDWDFTTFAFDVIVTF